MNEKANTEVSGPGDFNLMVDSNGIGYLAYDAWGNNHAIVIGKVCQKLSARWLRL